MFVRRSGLAKQTSVVPQLDQKSVYRQKETGLERHRKSTP